MKGYVFIKGVDGFGEDIAPAHELGVYLNFDKAFQKCMELNRGKYEIQDSDLKEKYPLKELCIWDSPWFGFYAIEEIEIIE